MKFKIKKRSIIIILLLTGIVFGERAELNNFNLISKNFKKILTEKNSINKDSYVKIETQCFEDLSKVINENIESYTDTLIVEKLSVSFIYIPFRKFPLFKKKWQRKANIKGWISLKGKRKLFDFIIEDIIKKNPINLENRNWDWTIGRTLENKEFIKPKYIETIIASTVTITILLSLFYVRS